jgi:UDP-glucose 4-epimerase
MRSPTWLPEAEVARLTWDAPDQLRDLCSRVDVVAHLAGMNAQDSEADPAAALAFNGGATARLLWAAISGGPRRFVYLSTGHVYASPLRGAISESTIPVASHAYATSHRAGEDAVRSAHEAREIDGIVVRLSNAFGAPTDVEANCWMLLVNDLCRQAVQTGRMVLRSTGLQRRDFISMTEACEALAHLMELPAECLGDGLFNVGGGWSPTVLEMTEALANRVAISTGVRPEIQRPPAASGDRPDELCFVRQKLLDTGFKPANREVVDRELDVLVQFCVDHKPQLAP